MRTGEGSAERRAALSRRVLYHRPPPVEGCAGSVAMRELGCTPGGYISPHRAAPLDLRRDGVALWVEVLALTTDYTQPASHWDELPPCSCRSVASVRGYPHCTTRAWAPRTSPRSGHSCVRARRRSLRLHSLSCCDRQRRLQHVSVGRLPRTCSGHSYQTRESLGEVPPDCSGGARGCRRASLFVGDRFSRWPVPL